VTLLIFRVKSSSFNRICHPACSGSPWDRRAAQWRDLRFLSVHPIWRLLIRVTTLHLSSRAQPRDLQCAPAPAQRSPLVLPQNRHPERSAARIDRVTQRFWRGAEGPRRRLSYPCCSEFFNHEPEPGPLPVHETSTVTIQCESQRILFSGFRGRKAQSSIGKITTAEILRLRATSAMARDKSVRALRSG